MKLIPRDIQPRATCRACLLVLLACSFCELPTASATTGGVSQLPTGKFNPTGVTVQVDSRWIDAVGYRPVRVTISAVKPPAKRDRQFRVVLRPFGNKTQVSQIIELHEGTAQATATILVPQDSNWDSLGIDVFEDGRILDELSIQRFSYGNNLDWNESRPGLLVIDADAHERDPRAEVLLNAERHIPDKVQQAFAGRSLPDVRNLVRIFKSVQPNEDRSFVNENSAAVEPQIILHEINQASKADLLPFAELPERWLDLSAFDLIVISQADLLALGKQHPEKLQAIADWTRSGRTLIVYGLGDDFLGLAAIEKTLQLAVRPTFESHRYRGWRAPNLKDRGGPMKHYDPDVYNRWGPRSATKLATTTSEPTLNVHEAGEGDRPAESWGFLIRPAGLGHVVAFEGNPFPGSETNWNWLFNSIPGSSWNPMVRTGATMQYRNEDFWNFLIAGIGQAPVFSFVIFISLFVTLIGPVNYYYLQRRQRLYLLLVTVPAGALLVTFGLFMYAVIVDGLGVKSRVRSVTMIDQRAGTGASVSRQAYYASLAPSQGFGFADDTEVRPYVHKPPRRHSDRKLTRGVVWNEHDQQLKSGFISSRTLSQLLVTKVDKTKAKLRVGPAKGSTLPVTNELQANLSWLLVLHSDGQYYAGADIQAGKVAELANVTRSDAVAELKKRLRPFEPEFPIGYSEEMHDTPLEWIEGGPYRYREPSPAEQSTSLLERSIARYGTLYVHPLEPGAYVALADNSPLVPLGVPSRQYGSLHVIEGSY